MNYRELIGTRCYAGGIACQPEDFFSCALLSLTLSVSVGSSVCSLLIVYMAGRPGCSDSAPTPQVRIDPEMDPSISRSPIRQSRDLNHSRRSAPPVSIHRCSTTPELEGRVRDGRRAIDLTDRCARKMGRPLHVSMGLRCQIQPRAASNFRVLYRQRKRNRHG